MNGPKIFWTGIFLLAMAASAQSQCPLSLQVSHTPVQQLSIGDVDFQHFQSRTLLFTVAIGNSSSAPANAVLSITVNADLDDGSHYDPAISYKSLPFPVAAGGQTYTNLDMGSSSTVIKTATYTYDDAAKQKMDDVVLGTGRFPAGRYSFFVKVTCEDGSGEKDDHFVLVLVNASRMELRSPADGETVSQFPLLEYYTDATDAQIIVGELMQYDSRQDAIDRQPPMVSADLQNQNAFFYSGGRPLEDGKTYCWQVIGKNLLSGGTNTELKSEIRKFTVSTSALTDDELLREIEEMLGPKYTSIFDQIRAGGFKLTGQFTNNNAPLTQGELLNLVNEVRDMLDNGEIVFQ